MKLNKLFTFTLAALAMAACSNDDEPGIDKGGQKGELIDAISIAFTSSSAPATRADKGEIEGTGSENDVYVAYLFAKENEPLHEGAKVGDWTVKRVAGDSSVDKDEDVSTAIQGGDVATPGTKKNMCTFNGVRQGDSVYVVVNDPQMTLATAQTLAHQGDKSEAAIRAYISNLSKSYLNDLTVAIDGKQKGKYIMAGVSAIPTNPNIPNGSTVKVSIPLNRELAKVFFNASVTTNPVYEAYGKMAIKDTEWKPDGTTEDPDGIVVVRIPRRVSPFKAQARDWYFPQSADATAKDWDVEGWLKAFAGESQSAPGTPEVSGTPALNKGEHNADAKEYRLTWVVGEKALADGGTPQETSIVYVKSDKLYSPYFYVTPNYADNAGCATVVVTQATYIGANTLLEPTITEEMLDKALQNDAFKTATSTDGTTKYDKLAADFWNTEKNVDALVAFLNTEEAYKLALRGETEIAKQRAAITIQKNDKRYYRADVANYSDDETTSMKITERNTFYHITGTITTLGAKSIEDAINSDNIDMLVQVVVKPWKYVVNNINM